MSEVKSGEVLTDNVRIHSFESLLTPQEIRRRVPAESSCLAHVARSREAIRRALAGEDDRQVVIVGPCSIHDEKAALEYATRLAALARRVEDEFIIIMRVYFEKPRTTVGWKGLINDPHLDGSNDIEAGLLKGRKILVDINRLGVACATEFLDPIVPQYISDLISWAAIGARTTESQTHREMASGLSMPVGFKNATDGGLDVAINAMVSARHPHAFLGIDDAGNTAIVKTRGNPDVHVILRGGGGRSNYGRPDIAYTKALLELKNERTIMVDCSHGNSDKDFKKQSKVFETMIDQVIEGESAILGMMLESHLVEGRQDLGRGELCYGQSITDGCISWETTEALFKAAHARLAARRK